MEALLSSEKLERRKHISHRHYINDEMICGRLQGTLNNMTCPDYAKFFITYSDVH
jgi:hypothetical protein